MREVHGRTRKRLAPSATRPGDAEEVFVGVVRGEVDEDGARSLVDPLVFLKLNEHVL